MYPISFKAALLCLCSVQWAHSYVNFHRFYPSRKASSILYSSSDRETLWKDSVDYVDLAAVSPESSPTARSLPLFLLGGAFYPEGVTFLNVFEMKYRTMMFDCANSDDMFGYMHTHPTTGQIASVGTMVKIVDRQLLEDGRQYIAVEGVGRFKVNKILKTLPYVLAEVEPNLNDDDVENLEEIIKLEKETYKSLKYYMRLMKSYDKNSDMKISPATKKNRPVFANCVGLTEEENAIRRTKFSFSLASMIQMTQSKETQLLLQTTSIMKRLRAEKDILFQASELVSDQLMQMKIIDEEQKNKIKEAAFNDDDDDNDLLPQESVQLDVEVEKDEWDISNIE